MWRKKSVFCCSSYMFVCWFHLHSCVSGVRPHFGAYPKIGVATFSCLHVTISCLQLTVFTLSPLAANLLFSVFHPTPGAPMAFTFEFLLPIRTQFTADMFFIFNLGASNYFTHALAGEDQSFTTILFIYDQLSVCSA